MQKYLKEKNGSSSKRFQCDLMAIEREVRERKIGDNSHFPFLVNLDMEGINEYVGCYILNKHQCGRLRVDTTKAMSYF